MAATHADLHLSIVLEQALQFRYGLRRNNDLGFVTAGKFQFDIEHGEPAPVRGDEGEFIFLEAEENAVEHIACLIRRDGVGGFAQTIVQILLPHCHHFCVFKLWQRREFFFRQAEDFEKALSAANRSGVLPINFDGDFAGGQFPNDGEQAARWQGGCAHLVDIGFKTSADSDIEVGGGEVHRSLLGLQQNVGKNWQRGPGADDILHLLQSFE